MTSDDKTDAVRQYALGKQDSPEVRAIKYGGHGGIDPSVTGPANCLHDVPDQYQPQPLTHTQWQDLKLFIGRNPPKVGEETLEAYVGRIKTWPTVGPRSHKRSLRLGTIRVCLREMEMQLLTQDELLSLVKGPLQAQAVAAVKKLVEQQVPTQPGLITPNP